VNVNPALQKRVRQLLADYGTKVRILVERHGLAKYGIDGADVEQEVWIRLWRAIKREPQATFNSCYIQRVVMSTAIDAIRAASRRPTEPLPDEDNEGIPLIEPNANPERAAVWSQKANLVAEHLRRLPKRRRVAVQLCFAGFTAQEIGEQIGTSHEAARKMIDRGLTTLRGCLSDAGILAAS
jgi:RNA polymerase sigma factor (sigma-70 family)